MSRAYGRSACWVCDQHISNAGCAYVAHMRKHVREGKVEEVRATPYGGYSFRRVKTQDTATSEASGQL